MGQTAVIKEALRIGTPTPAGLPRVVPPAGAVISGVEIPEGVRVSNSSIFGQYLMSSTDGCKPEPPFRVVFRRGVCSAVRVPSGPVASAGIQCSGELAGYILERTAQLPRHKVSARVFGSW